MRRKTSDQIKDEILFSLNTHPLSIDQIRKKVESNWSTINNYLDELTKEGKVKEIITSDKSRIYQRIFGDTYFDIPITELQRKKFRTLFSYILEESKKQKYSPKKTHFAKCAVELIKNPLLKLSDLPVVSYIYGSIPLMIADPGINYSNEFNFDNEEEIKTQIKIFIEKNKHNSSNKVKIESHKKYEDDLYNLSDIFYKEINSKDMSTDKIAKLLDDFFIACPVDSNFPEVFEYTEKVTSTIRKLILLDKNILEYRKEILTTFDSLWKLIALYKLYNSSSILDNGLDKETLFKFYLSHTFDSRKKTLEEDIREITSIYLNKLASFDQNKIILSDDSKKIREIMKDFTGED